MGRTNRCPACGATTTAGAPWCGGCYAPLPPALGERDTVPPVWAGALARTLTTDPDPVPPPEFSRWDVGETTFGPMGRFALSLVIVLFVVIGWVMFLPLGMAFTVVYLGVAGAPALYVLRQIWRRARVR